MPENYSQARILLVKPGVWDEVKKKSEPLINNLLHLIHKIELAKVRVSALKPGLDGEKCQRYPASGTNNKSELCTSLVLSGWAGDYLS